MRKFDIENGIVELLAMMLILLSIVIVTYVSATIDLLREPPAEEQPLNP